MEGSTASYILKLFGVLVGIAGLFSAIAIGVEYESIKIGIIIIAGSLLPSASLYAAGEVVETLQASLKVQIQIRNRLCGSSNTNESAEESAGGTLQS